MINTVFKFCVMLFPPLHPHFLERDEETQVFQFLPNHIMNFRSYDLLDIKETHIKMQEWPFFKESQKVIGTPLPLP